MACLVFAVAIHQRSDLPVLFDWMSMQMKLFGAVTVLSLFSLGLAGPTAAYADTPPAPLIIVADDERTLDDGPLGHLDALAYGGGFALDNTILVVNGGEVRRLATVMPLAPVLTEYQRIGLRIYVCADAEETQRYVDQLPLLPGVQVLKAETPPKGAPADLAKLCLPGTIPSTL